jgi:hypothetical protein
LALLSQNTSEPLFIVDSLTPESSMSRPFFKTRIGELEAAFDRERSDPEYLRMLIEELSHRSTGRAARLKARAVQALGTLRKSSDHRPNPDNEANAKPLPASVVPISLRPTVETTAEHAPSERKPMPPISNAPHAILSAWTALEVLSPPSFQRPEDLANGDKRAVARLDGGRFLGMGTVKWLAPIRGSTIRSCWARWTKKRRSQN